MLGLLADGCAYVLIAFATQGWMAFPILLPLALGGLVVPALQALLAAGRRVAPGAVARISGLPGGPDLRHRPAVRHRPLCRARPGLERLALAGRRGAEPGRTGAVAAAGQTRARPVRRKRAGDGATATVTSLFADRPARTGVANATGLPTLASLSTFKETRHDPPRRSIHLPLPRARQRAAGRSATPSARPRWAWSWPARRSLASARFCWARTALRAELATAFPDATLQAVRDRCNLSWPPSPPISTTATPMRRWRWTWAAPPSSSRCGRRSPPSRPARPAATASWRASSARPTPRAPWPAPAPPTCWPWPFLPSRGAGRWRAIRLSLGRRTQARAARRRARPMMPETCAMAPDLNRHDWEAIARALDARGNARLPGLLDPRNARLWLPDTLRRTAIAAVS